MRGIRHILQELLRSNTPSARRKATLSQNDSQSPGNVLAVTGQDGLSRNVDASAGMATDRLVIIIIIVAD